MRAQASANLSCDRIRIGCFDLGRGWTGIDLTNAAIVDDLKAYVGHYVTLHPLDLGELSKLGLMMSQHGRVVDAPAPSQPESVKADDAKKKK